METRIQDHLLKKGYIVDHYVDELGNKRQRMSYKAPRVDFMEKRGEFPMISDLSSHLKSFVGTDNYLNFASTCKDWRNAWGQTTRKTTKIDTCISLEILQDYINSGMPKTQSVCVDLLRMRRPDLIEFAFSKGFPIGEKLCAEAVKEFDINTLKWSRANGAKWDSTAWEAMAITSFDEEIADYLLCEGCPIDEDPQRHVPSKVARYAARRGNTELLDYLEEDLIDINVDDSLQMSYISEEAAKGNQEEVLLWMDKHDYDWKEDVEEMTWAAIDSLNPEFIITMMENGAEEEVRSVDVRSLLSRKLKRGFVTKWALANGF